ncbi:MAG TPA: hypothetical protein DDY27_05075, partial [Hyphomonadaceae bacterium]|nr:hypothetical protein [Hyphomonadaceae bacterium]
MPTVSSAIPAQAIVQLSFLETPQEREIAEASLAELVEGDTLPAPIVTEIIDQETFWPAEDYHQ